jgi:hypothetical protein
MLALGQRLNLVPIQRAKLYRDNGLLIGGEKMAWLLGFFCAEGSCSFRPKDYSYTSFSNADLRLLEKAQDISEELFSKHGHIIFDKLSKVYALRFAAFTILYYFQSRCYTPDKKKRVPNEILNASKLLKLAFLRGYNDGGDGAHYTKITGHGGHRWDWEFQTFTTNSEVQAAGLLFLVQELLLPDQSFTVSTRPDKPTIYKIQLLRPNSNRPINDRALIHQRDLIEYHGYLYDFETEDHFFATGIGPVIVHNTDLLWRMMDYFGKDAYHHESGLVVHHPEPMKSVFDARVEKQFYLRHAQRCIENFLPVDLRMPSVILAVDPDPKHRELAAAQQKEFIAKGYMTAEGAALLNEEMQRAMA